MWHYLYIQDPKKAYLVSTEFMQPVSLLANTQSHRDAAVFSRLDQLTGGMHYYFSPQAESVALQYGTASCEKPSRENLGNLLAGEYSVIARLY